MISACYPENWSEIFCLQVRYIPSFYAVTSSYFSFIICLLNAYSGIAIRFIYLEDFMRFMREDEALKTIRLFEGGTEAKGVSKRALKTWVVSTICLYSP